MEFNFPLFFGLAIQAYEATLVSNKSRFDLYRENAGSNPLSTEELQGLDVFMTKGRCIACHNGAEFTSASVSHISAENLIERMHLNVLDRASIRLYDTGFYRLGQQSQTEDIGLGNTAPRTGRPLSFTRNFLEGTISQQIDPCKFESPFSESVPPYVLPLVPPSPLCSFLPPLRDLQTFERLVIDGSFKTASLRNVELTAPYFHNGQLLTLNDVVNFYNLGGGAFGAEHPDVTVLGLTQLESYALVAFLKTLTDPRVKKEQAPFDHPEMCIPNGHDLSGVNAFNEYPTKLVMLPAVGALGGAEIATFNDLLNGTAAGKAHDLTAVCGLAVQ